MPRFYFNLRNDISVDDDEGAVLPDLVAARQHALSNARSIAAANVYRGRLDLSLSIEIVDHTGELADTVTFGDAVTVVN